MKSETTSVAPSGRRVALFIVMTGLLVVLAVYGVVDFGLDHFPYDKPVV